MRNTESTVSRRPASATTRATVSTCPNCGQTGLRTVYSANQIPAHSVLLMPDQETASNYPRGDMRLAFCSGCGFFSNTAFDVSLNEYSPDYEETQHFSPRFNQFAESLVNRLVDDFDIRNKRVLEIGCGKAEFLDLLCQAGDNQGIGVDPSVRPERLTAETRERLTLVPELYSEEHASLSADIICCRHTLEHIHPTFDFLNIVRRSIGDRSDVTVVFELPDMRIILEETRFWDVYYEHCSYFTAGSLARLFRACRFDITDLWREYDDQYILLVAKPSQANTQSTLAIEDDLEEIAFLTDAFETNSRKHIDHWRETIRSYHQGGQRPVLWGAGSKCVAFLTTAGLEDEIEVVVDINPHKQGRFLPATGHPVVSPEYLQEYAPGVVVVMNPIYAAEVAAVLSNIGVSARVVST